MACLLPKTFLTLKPWTMISLSKHKFWERNEESSSHGVYWWYHLDIRLSKCKGKIQILFLVIRLIMLQSTLHASCFRRGLSRCSSCFRRGLRIITGKRCRLKFRIWISWLKFTRIFFSLTRWILSLYLDKSSGGIFPFLIQLKIWSIYEILWSTTGTFHLVSISWLPCY